MVIKKNRLKIFIIVAVIILLSIVPVCYIVNQCYRNNLKLTISCTNASEKVYQYGDEYYYKQSDGLFRLSDSTKVVDFNGFSCLSFIVGENNIYCLTNNQMVMIYDKQDWDLKDNIIAPENTKCLLGVSDDFLICSVHENNSAIKNIIAISISDESERSILGQFNMIDEIGVYEDNSLQIYWLNGEAILSIQNKNTTNHSSMSSERILAATENKICSTHNLNLSTFDILDLNKNCSLQIKISDAQPIWSTGITLSYCNENKLVLIGNSAEPLFGVGSHGDFNSSDQLKYHKYDAVAVYDINSGNLLSEKKFKTFERVIGISDNAIVTYYKGEYRTYSLSDLKVINKQSADEIKDGGSYTFETCGEYIFVFDDNTGELLNTISVT